MSAEKSVHPLALAGGGMHSFFRSLSRTELLRFCRHYNQKQQRFPNYKSVSEPDDLHNEVNILLAAHPTST